MSPETEATGVEMTFISATYTPADKHLKSTCDKYGIENYVDNGGNEQEVTLLGLTTILYGSRFIT